jgi:FixJ family two-component response regulator
VPPHRDEATAGQPVVFVVDDDEAVRESLRWLINSVNLGVEVFDSAADFLDGYAPGRPGCLVSDVRMPGLSGLDLQRELNRRGITLPVILITGHGDVPMAVRAMKQGAYDFVEKPFNDQVLLDLVQKAVAESVAAEATLALHAEVLGRIEQLTPREREVLGLIVAGETNKGIARTLDISLKTVEAHRAKVMEKMRAGSLAELMKSVMVLEDYQGKP